MKGRNPNDVVLNTPPIYSTTTQQTQLIYGPTEPLLIDSMDYVWQVRARDKNGRDLFRNNGFSEVCFFTYGGADPNFTIREMDNLQVELLTDRIARLHWTDGSATVSGEFDTYRLQFRKDDPQFDWHLHETDSTEQMLYDLVPLASYEARIQGGRKDAAGRLYWGEYSPIIKFTMPEERVLVCGEGDPYLQRNNPGKPKYDVIKSDEVDAYGIPMVMQQVNNLGEGFYQGTGYVRVAMLANARMPVKFERIFINDSLQVTAGKIEMLTRGVQALRDSLDKDITIDGPTEGPTTPGDSLPELPELIIPVVGTIEEIYINDQQQIVVTDAEGNQQVLDREKDSETGNYVPVQVVDDAGNTYVVDSEGKVEKVDGGMAVANTIFDTETIGIIQQALKNLSVKYDENYKSNNQSLLARYEEELLNYISQSNKFITQESNHSFVDTEPFLYDFNETQTIQEDQIYTNLNKAYKESELEYNKTNIIIYINKNFDQLNIASLFNTLTIDNKKLNDYITSNSNKNREEITIQIQEEIERLIEKEIKDKSNQL